jgi:acetyltransferase EpsM
MYILGAGTLGEIVLETALRAGIKVEGFYDDISKATECDGIPIHGPIADFRKDGLAHAKAVFVAIGDNQKRRDCIESLKGMRIQFPNVIDPKVTLSPSVSLGHGNLVLPGAYIGTKCVVGSHNLIFPGVSITHHNRVGDFCFFSPNASVGGFTQIGDTCKVGMNCVVLPYREILSGTECPPASVFSGLPLSPKKKPQ